jgi:hypothetical protein
MDYGRLGYFHLIPLFSDSMYQSAGTRERPQQDTLDSQDMTCLPEALLASVGESIGASGL